MINKRNKTKKIIVRDLPIGGGSPVSIQSMTNLPIEDVRGTVEQIKKLNMEGAELVRLAVRNEDSIQYLKKIRKEIDTPLSADIHFNYKIAIMAMEAGIDKVRINPGNIGDEKKVREVVKAAKDNSVPIRIGVNGGSIDRKKYSSVTPESLVESAEEHIKILEDNDYFEIAVSIKSSDIHDTIESNKLFAEKMDYPLHIGLTEAGYGLACTVQSSIALGYLLLEGIGDTLRVSMTGDPVDEIIVAKRILESIGERNPYIKMIACPTCGRTDPTVDLREHAQKVEAALRQEFTDELRKSDRTITVAVMGCEVNGPGEASHADIGVAGGRDGKMLLFSRGKKLKLIHVKDIVTSLMDEARKIITSRD